VQVQGCKGAKVQGCKGAEFLRIAVGSINETRDHLIDGHSRGYLTVEELKRGTRLAKRAAGATNGLIVYLVNSDDPNESGSPGPDDEERGA
jgi:hypothetical protein